MISYLRLFEMWLSGATISRYVFQRLHYKLRKRYDASIKKNDWVALEDFHRTLLIKPYKKGTREYEFEE